MSRFVFLIAAIYQCRSSFLQCSPSDSLEPIDALDGSEHGHIQLVNCDRWPFYSGGHPHSNGYSSSSSSSDDSSDEDRPSLESLLPATIASFDDGVEKTKCLEQSDAGVCMKWSVTKQEYEDEYGCGHYRSSEASLLTDYELCLCAVANDNYCEEWACLDVSEYPHELGSYSLIKDNQFIMDKVDASNPLIGDFWRFADKDGMVELEKNMQLKNCWCQTDGSDAEACDDWFCGTLKHEEWYNDFGDFAVDGFGRFGCYEVDGSSLCDNWYGFMYHGADYKYHDRDEYRCQCVDDECLSTICGLKQIPVRQNWLWWNFPLAFIVWACCCGCCGTKMCFKKRDCYKLLKCRKLRMFLFFTLFGGIALFHGGVPAFLFFCIIFSCSLCGAIKREKYGKCGRGRCCGMKKWRQHMANCEAKQTKKGTTDYVGVSVKETDDVNGENSKEESVDAVEMKVVE